MSRQLYNIYHGPMDPMPLGYFQKSKLREMYRSLVQGGPRIQLEAPFEMAENKGLTWGEITLLIGYRAYDLIYNW